MAYWRQFSEDFVEVDGERLMTTLQLSEMLGVPVDTIYAWRHRGTGPVGYRVGRHVRYRRAAVEAWLEVRVDDRGSTKSQRTGRAPAN